MAVPDYIRRGFSCFIAILLRLQPAKRPIFHVKHLKHHETP